MSKNLVIVESPAKAKTIEKYLGKDFTVKSSFGHVRDLSKKQLGVDVEKDFAPKYEVDNDKKKVIAELKSLSDNAEMVWLASDEDREGEAIAWHLSETLKLKKDKTKRIVFHEITKNAILEAIENPREIDINLVNAQQARRVLDRLVGFELSPLLWKKIKPSLSAGRVQSVAVRLIVERENEINNFNSVTYYRVTGTFITSKDEMINAELSEKFDNKEDALTFLEHCKNTVFTVAATEKKPAKKSPAPPFTTSTLQQEASRKLSFSVSKTMMVAQQLYEAGLITYMRTDSVNLSTLALGMAKEQITGMYGNDYVKTRNFTTKTKGAQEAHEAIRPTFMNNVEAGGDASQKKLYDLIWKRTIASQMADAQIEKTIITITIDKNPYEFIARGEVILFDGFLKVYSESTDEDEDEQGKNLLPIVKKGENLSQKIIEATQKFTKSPARFTEASLVKRMEELGIGRPSTYAPTITTIIKRDYVVKEDRDGITRDYTVLTLQGKNLKENQKKEKTGFEKSKLFPTDIGILVNDFLVQYFKDIVDYNFTAKVEAEFDSIAEGKKVWNQMIKTFYKGFSKKVLETDENSSKFSGERLLGTDPKSGKNIYVKVGRFGPMIQIGEATDEEKPKFAGLKKEQSLANITIEEALKLFEFPKKMGVYEEIDVTVAVGRFGPYVKHGSKFYSLKKDDSPETIELERCIELIEEKRNQEKNNLLKEFTEDTELKVLNGRFGPYVAYKGKNFKIQKGTDPLTLSFEDCVKLTENTETKKSNFRKKSSRKK